jgi:hypothetical protein
MAAMEAIRGVMATEHDDAGRAGLDRMLSTLSGGRLNEAARLAALIAGPLPAKRAAIVLRLPTSMMAATRLVRAQSARRDRDPRLAMEFAVEARHLDPLVGRSVYEEIRAERAEALRVHAAELERAGNSLLARAYWVALAALVAGSSDAARGLVTTLPAAMTAVSVRLAIAPAREDVTLGLLTSLLVGSLPKHIAVVAPSERPDAVLSYLAAAPERSFRVSKSYRSKAISIGKVPTANPNYEIAEEEVANAQSGLEQARENYRQLHEQAQQNAQRAASTKGGWGSAFAGVAGAGEGVGVAMLKRAEGRLADARSNLRQTPRTTLEDVEDQVRFPVLQIDASAVTRLWLRLDGLGDPVEEKGEATASASAEQIAAAPSIGVPETRPDVAKLSGLTPDVEPVLRGAVARLASRVRALEEEHAWGAFVALRDAGAVEPAATAAIDYLTVAGESAPHRPEIAEFLVRSLP